jgi:hypothetical protein
MISPVDVKLARRSLLAKGFRSAENGGRRDHEMYFFWLDGKKTSVWVKISRGATEIRRDNIRINARAIHLCGDDLFRILHCEHDATRTRELAAAAAAELAGGSE